MTLSSGICFISSCDITKIQFVPFVFGLLSPCAILPNYFPKAVVHTSLVTGSLANFRYCVIVSPVTGCTTGAQKCSMSMSYLFSLLVVGLEQMNAFGSHVVSTSPYTLLVKRFTASCEMMCGDANGILYEFGFVGCDDVIGTGSGAI